MPVVAGSVTRPPRFVTRNRERLDLSVHNGVSRLNRNADIASWRWTVRSRHRRRIGSVNDAAQTAKGRATRTRIIAAAAELIGRSSIAETSLDDIIDQAGVSKGQLYHYFADRSELLRAVIAYNADTVLAAQAPHLESLATWKAIRSWFNSLVELQIDRAARGGCPIGSLVGQLAESDEQALGALETSFARWQRHLCDGLQSMRARGLLSRQADPVRLATATMAALQGGLLLTQVRRDPEQLAIALDAAYAHLRNHRRRTPSRPSPTSRSTTSPMP